MPPRYRFDAYISWLDRVQVEKHNVWEEARIFEFIRLSRHLKLVNFSLIGASVFFWNRTTNKMGPTLFDMSAITGLRPHGPAMHSSVEVKKQIDDYVPKCSFSKYITYFRGGDQEPVTNTEHVAFLFLWLCANVFCSKSATLIASYVPLAIFSLPATE